MVRRVLILLLIELITRLLKMRILIGACALVNRQFQFNEI
jgi:hypothetical protein